MAYIRGVTESYKTMKHRSLKKMISLNFITLGLYELYWLSSTRNEMVKKFHVQIPSSAYMVILRGLLLVEFISVVVIVFYTGTVDDAFGYVIAVLLIIISMAIINSMYLKRWIVPYAIAAETATNKRISATAVELMLSRVVPVVGPTTVQKVFNQT